MFLKGFWLYLILLTLILSACAHIRPEPARNGQASGMPQPAAAEKFEEEEFTEVADPIEPWNRLMFTFNDRFYFWVFKPAARGYNAVAPEAVRISVRNFFNNLTTPVRLASAILQGDIKDAGIEIGRFGVNSTIGVAGIFDVARDKLQIGMQEKDFGQTLGKYGMGEAFYIIWPFAGPSSLRDTVGSVGDGFLTPMNYITPGIDAFAVNAYDYFNRGSLRLGEYEDLKESSIEPYVTLRDAYIQHRRSLINK